MREVVKANPEMAQTYNFPFLISKFEEGKDRICRNAPHLFIAHTSATNPVGPKDANIATAYLELLLPAFKLGGCWSGYAVMAFQHSKKLKILNGIDDTQVVHSVMMTGYPKYQYSKIPVRNKMNVIWK